MNNKNRRFPLLFGGVFLTVGLAFLIVGVLVLNAYNKFAAAAVKVPGAISRIERYRNSRGKTSHSVYVSYSYNGEHYRDIPINAYTSDMYEGKGITVLLDPAAPDNIQVEGSATVLCVIFTGMGAIFAVIGAVPIIIAHRNVLRRKRLTAGGKKLDAVIDEISQNTSLTMNGRHPYIVYCAYTDDKGTVYRFKSANLWTNPSLVVNVGDTIPVYINEADFSDYYVDTDGALDGRLIDLT